MCHRSTSWSCHVPLWKLVVIRSIPHRCLISWCLSSQPQEWVSWQKTEHVYVLGWDEFESGRRSSWGKLNYSDLSTIFNCWKTPYNGMLTLTLRYRTRARVPGARVCVGKGECEHAWCFRPRWAELVLVLSLNSNSASSWSQWLLTDLCDDKCTAWHLNVESLLALTDLVGSGVGQSHLDGFKCNVISSSGFSVTCVGDGTGDLWSPPVLQR